MTTSNQKDIILRIISSKIYSKCFDKTFICDSYENEEPILIWTQNNNSYYTEESDNQIQNKCEIVANIIINSMNANGSTFDNYCELTIKIINNLRDDFCIEFKLVDMQEIAQDCTMAIHLHINIVQKYKHLINVWNSVLIQNNLTSILRALDTVFTVDDIFYEFNSEVLKLLDVVDKNKKLLFNPALFANEIKKIIDFSFYENHPQWWCHKIAEELIATTKSSFNKSDFATKLTESQHNNNIIVID